MATGRAVFLDRDGVLNCNVFYADTQRYESPRTAAALVLAPGAPGALRALRQAGYRLILVSNQPNAAKGKCSREELHRIHARLEELLAAEAVTLDACYYCFHHPDHTGMCACRKPGTFFLLEAAARYALELRACWMIGDRASDIACGQAAGTRTLWIDNAEGQLAPGRAADITSRDFSHAVSKLLQSAAVISG